MRAFLLTPGASGGPDQPALLSIEQGVSDLVMVQRYAVPSGSGARAVAGITAAVEALAARAGCKAAEVVLGGRSYGGRMCSVAVADGLPAAGLALISYPLHPPGKPTQLRTEHFPRIEVPCLFVSGTRDAFGTPAEREQATSVIPGPVTDVWIEGGDHGLRRHDAAVVDAVREFLIHLRDSAPRARGGRSPGKR